MIVMPKTDQKVPSQRNRLVFGVILVTLLFTQASLFAGLSWSTSLNSTEVGHIGATVYFWHTGKFDVFRVNPPLTRSIVGIPLALFCNPNYNWERYSARPQDRSEWVLGLAFINANEPDDLRLYVFLMRTAYFPLFLLGGYFSYHFASELYGVLPGVVLLNLWVFSPLVLAWGATICPDVCAASLGIIGVYTFWHWLKTPTWGKTITAGICLGLLPLTKMTWIIAFPLWFLIWFIWVIPYFIKRNSNVIIPGWKQLAAILLIGVYMINMGYAFDGSFRQLRDYKFISHTLTGREINEKSLSVVTGNRFEKSWLGYVPVPLPGEFVQGIDTQKLDFERGIESYLRGEYSRHGWWYYYVYTILIKEPLGTLCLGVLAIITTIFLTQYNASWRDEMVVILPGLVFFIFVSSQNGFSLHPRYIIPALPFAYIWISKLGQSFAKKQYPLSTVTVILLIWMVGSSLYYFPHSMSYFNELVGGPKNGPKHLLGSNVDWGQNSYFLQKWYNKHPEARPIKIAYSSTESLDRLGIKDTQQPPKEPEPGWFALGVNEIYASSKQYEYFKQFEPVDFIGYSIYIYHIKLDEANNVRCEMGLQRIEDNYL